MPSNQSIWLRLFRWLLTLAAYGYLLYLMLTYKEYPGLLAHFREADWSAWLSLSVCLLLFPLNISLESAKWRYLLQPVISLSPIEALRQTYFGIVGAFVSPYRVGEYPTRVMRIEDKSLWPAAISMGFVGSIALSSVNILMGLLAIIFTPLTSSVTIARTTLIGAAILLLGSYLLLIYLLPRLASRVKWLTPLQGITPRLFGGATGLSLIRYFVFCLQFALMLYFCGVFPIYSASAAFHFVLAIPIYYLLVTILPSLPAADAALRGSAAAIAFSAFTSDTAPVALAAMLLWVINTLFPMFIGTFMKKSH